MSVWLGKTDGFGWGREGRLIYLGTAAIDEIEMWPKSSSMVCSMVWRGKEGLGGNKHLRRNGNKARKEGDDSLHKNTHKNTYKSYIQLQKYIQK